PAVLGAQPGKRRRLSGEVRPEQGPVPGHANTPLVSNPTTRKLVYIAGMKPIVGSSGQRAAPAANRATASAGRASGSSTSQPQALPDCHGASVTSTTSVAATAVPSAVSEVPAGPSTVT